MSKKGGVWEKVALVGLGIVGGLLIGKAVSEASKEKEKVEVKP